MSESFGRYAIGATNPPKKLQDMGLPDPHPTDLKPYTEEIVTANYSRLRQGRPVATWRFGMLENWQMQQLVAFVSGASKRLYITTRVNSGISPGVDGLVRTPEYHTFYCIMHYPKSQTFKPGGLFADVEIEFTDLTNAPPTG
jgi:hypothetical protein